MIFLPPPGFDDCPLTTLQDWAVAAITLCHNKTKIVTHDGRCDQNGNLIREAKNPISLTKQDLIDISNGDFTSIGGK